MTEQEQEITELRAEVRRLRSQLALAEAKYAACSAIIETVTRAGGLPSELADPVPRSPDE